MNEDPVVSSIEVVQAELTESTKLHLLQFLHRGQSQTSFELSQLSVAANDQGEVESVDIGARERCQDGLGPTVHLRSSAGLPNRSNAIGIIDPYGRLLLLPLSSLQQMAPLVRPPLCNSEKHESTIRVREGVIATSAVMINACQQMQKLRSWILKNEMERRIPATIRQSTPLLQHCCNTPREPLHEVNEFSAIIPTSLSRQWSGLSFSTAKTVEELAEWILSSARVAPVAEVSQLVEQIHPQFTLERVHAALSTRAFLLHNTWVRISAAACILPRPSAAIREAILLAFYNAKAGVELKTTTIAGKLGRSDPLQRLVTQLLPSITERTARGWILPGASSASERFPELTDDVLEAQKNIWLAAEKRIRTNIDILVGDLLGSISIPTTDSSQTNLGERCHELVRNLFKTYGVIQCDIARQYFVNQCQQNSSFQGKFKEMSAALREELCRFRGAAWILRTRGLGKKSEQLRSWLIDLLQKKDSLSVSVVEVMDQLGMQGITDVSIKLVKEFLYEFADEIHNDTYTIKVGLLPE